MIWYGIAAEERRCGFRSNFGDADDRRCGAPIRQTDAAGTPTDHYLTTTALRRPAAPGDTRVQSDYVDAANVPYVVMPGGLRLPNGEAWAPGDLAVIVWHGRTVYAMIGDTGPATKIGEASRAALAALHGGGVSPIAPEDPATTLVFPGTAARVMTTWPLSRAAIDTEGRKLVDQAGGRDALRACPGLSGLN
jgi:Fungal chitosanase of glycosyl hydrolase group 75